MQEMIRFPPYRPFCILLAGGQGTRLHELTQTECKPAIAFGGGRLVDFTMANAVRSGLRQMMVATQYRPEALVDHLDKVWRKDFGDYLSIRDGQTHHPDGYRGTADAVRANLPEIVASGAREVVILSADHVYDMDYRPMIARHRASGACVTVAVDEVPLAQAQGFGVLTNSEDGRIHAFHEKPRHPQPSLADPSKALVSLGIYVLDTAWLVQTLAEPGMDDFGHDVLPAAVAAGVAQIHRGAKAGGGRFYWRDVGTLTSYRLAQLDFLDPQKAPFVAPSPLQSPSQQAMRAAEQGNVLLPGAWVSPRARVHNTIIGPGAVIPDGMVIGEDPDEDRRWFRVVNDGTVLVTAAMLTRRRAERLRPLAIHWTLAPVTGR